MSTPDLANKPRRRSVNLTIREDIIAVAKALGVNASKAAESGIRAAVEAKRAEQWLKENAAGIRAHNGRIEKSGPLLTPDWTVD